MIHKATLWLLLAQLLSYFLETNAKVPAIIVFGDSSVDAGNNNEISTHLKSNFEPYGQDFYGGKPTGRFSNGRISSDFISEGFGLKSTIPAFLDPKYTIKDFATEVCFASAGTGYDNATSDVLELEYYKQYWQQLRRYLGREKAKKVLKEALYLISIGTNDFLENYYALPVRSSAFSVEEYQDFLIGIAKSFIIDLYKLGARKVSLGGLPPMGCLPLERTRNIMSGRQCIEVYNQVAKEFNGKLANLVGKLSKELKGSKLVFSDPYNIFLEIIQKPSSFGFNYADVACCATGFVEMSYMCDRFNPFTCTDAKRYIFWDSFHPTEKTNGLLATHLMKSSLAKFHD